MRRKSRIIAALLLSSVLCLTPTVLNVQTVQAEESQEPETVVVYVSQEQQGTGDGSLQQPFADIEQARDYLRTQNLDADHRGIVYIRGGVYHVSSQNPTIELGQEDSYVTYEAYEQENVTISGTVMLANDRFVKCTEAIGEQYSSSVRLPETVRDHVYVYDLGAEQISVGTINKNGFNWPKQPFQPELVVNGGIQTLAQYPNSGVMDMSTILAGKTKDGKNEDETAKAAGANEGERPRNYIFDKTDTPKNYEEMLAMKGPVFYCRNGLEERIAVWAPPTQEGESQADQPAVHPMTDNTRYETDGWLSGYFENNYANDMARIYSVNEQKQTINCKYPSFQGVQDKRIQMTAINLLCELDCEGEYYIDRYDNNNVLYYYPEGDGLSGQEVELTSSNEPFFALNGAQEITIRNINLDGGTGYGITMMDCESCLVEGCEISNLSLDAIQIGKNNDTITTDPSYTTSGGGHHNTVRNCTIHDMGCGGVYVAGGNEQTLERGDNLVEHCEIYNISRLQTYTPAVYLEGVGNTAQYNDIHDAPHMVIQIMGNDMLVTHNSFRDVCTNTSDQAAIYCGRCFNWLGNEISYNVFQNIRSGTYGIYMDDGMSGMLIHHNLFEDVTGCAIFSNSGFGHQITDNVMINTAAGVKYQAFSGSRPVANEKVLAYRYYRVLRTGDGTDYTNTQANINAWYDHYKLIYPYLNKMYYPAETDAAWLETDTSVFVPAHQVLERTVMTGQRASIDSKAVVSWQEDAFNTQNYYKANIVDLGFDLATGKFSSDSPLAEREEFGQEWIENWNRNFHLNSIGVMEPNSGMGDVDGNGVVDATDCLCVLKQVLGLEELSTEAKKQADTNLDDQIDVTDALLILRFVVDQVEALPQL